MSFLKKKKKRKRKKKKNDRSMIGVTHRRRRRYDNSNKGGEGKSNRDSEKLRPKRVSGGSRKTAEIRIIHDQGGKIRNCAHNAFDHSPRQSAPLQRSTLLDNGPQTVGSHDCPDEECHTSNRHDSSLHREQVSNFVHGRPQKRQTASPEQKKAHKIARISSRGCRHGIFTPFRTICIPRRPNRSNHQVDARPADPALHTIPNTCHDGAIEDGPETSPDAKGCSSDDGKAEVVFCSDATGEHDEAGGDSVADPDAEPGLPPG